MAPFTVECQLEPRGDKWNPFGTPDSNSVRCQTCDREVVGSNSARGCCVPTPTQHAIPTGSVNEYHRKLGSKRGYHTLHSALAPYLWSCVAASADVRLRAKETEISVAPWAPWGSGETRAKDFYYYCYYQACSQIDDIKGSCQSMAALIGSSPTSPLNINGRRAFLMTCSELSHKIY